MDEVNFGREESVSRKDDEACFIAAFSQPLARLSVYSCHLALSDTGNNGESKLIAASFNDGVSKFMLKVFSKTSLVSQNAILGLPSAVTSFNISKGVSAVGVAAGAAIFIYKNMRAFFKYTLPELELNQIEKEAWIHSREDNFDFENLADVLTTLRYQPGIPLSQRSRIFLNLSSAEERAAYAKANHQKPLSRTSNIVAMSAMKKSVPDENGVSCLIVATEESEIQIMDCVAFTVLRRVELPSVPVFIQNSGLFDVDYKIFVICRDGVCYFFDRDSEPRILFTLSTHAAGFVKVGAHLFVACTDETMHIYDDAGRIKHIRRLRGRPLAICELDVKDKGITGVLVSTSESVIQIFRKTELVDELKTNENVVALTFGRYDREDSTLVTVTENGALEVFFVRRKATFEKKEVAKTSREVGLAIKMPKMEQAYLDQIEVEKKNTASMMSNFQYDLSRIRLMAGREMLSIHKKSLAPSTDIYGISMTVSVFGVGPVFKLKISVTNTKETIDLRQRFVLGLIFNRHIFTIERKVAVLPLLLPGKSTTVEVTVRNTSENGETGDVKVLITPREKTKPVISSIVAMPIAEPLSV